MEFRNSNSGHENTVQSSGKIVDRKKKQKSVEPSWENTSSKELVFEEIPESQRFSVTGEQFDNWHDFLRKRAALLGRNKLSREQAIHQAKKEHPEGFRIDEELQAFIDNLGENAIVDAKNRYHRNHRKVENAGKNIIRDMHIKDIIAYYCKLHVNREQHRKNSIEKSGTTAETLRQEPNPAGRRLNERDREFYYPLMGKWKEESEKEWEEWAISTRDHPAIGSDEESEVNAFFGD